MPPLHANPAALEAQYARGLPRTFQLEGVVTSEMSATDGLQGRWECSRQVSENKVGTAT